MNESHIGALARVAAAQDPAVNDEKKMGPAFKDAGKTLAGTVKPENTGTPEVSSGGRYL